ncbi:MAG: hypothetical protein KH396_07355 [Atopobiaceae bacterium]|nr:hypothetical protein [Atopobiaceae bacterium]
MKDTFFGEGVLDVRLSERWLLFGREIDIHLSVQRGVAGDCLAAELLGAVLVFVDSDRDTPGGFLVVGVPVVLAAFLRGRGSVLGRGLGSSGRSLICRSRLRRLGLRLLALLLVRGLVGLLLLRGSSVPLLIVH